MPSRARRVFQRDIAIPQRETATPGRLVKMEVGLTASESVIRMERPMSRLAVAFTVAVHFAATHAWAQQQKVVLEVAAAGGFVGLPRVDVQSQPACRAGTGTATACIVDENRSEERRVGKECRL